MAGDPQFRLHSRTAPSRPRGASGDIDLHNVEALQRLILDADSPPWWWTCPPSPYCDSATLGVLLAAAKTTRLTLVVPAGGRPTG